MKRTFSLVVLALLAAALNGCGGGNNGSGLLGAGNDEGTGSPFSFGALSGRAASTNPPITTNGTGATITAIKGDISSLFLNDTSNNLAETRIAYASSRDGNFEIYIGNADGTNPLNLTKNPATDNYPALSPDGQWVVFGSKRDGGAYEIYKMTVNGNSVTRLTNSVADEIEPAWSPDGQWIAFASNSGGGDYEIYKMKSDGSGVTPLTNNTVQDFSPCWSPDGQKIAFSSQLSGNPGGNMDIYYMNAANGSDLRPLTNDPSQDVSPAWSPDGSTIAFNSYRADNYEIYVMDAYSGAKQTRITTNSSFDVSPSWSPDGKRIAFSSDRDGNEEIYTMDINGNNVARLTNNVSADADPSWGPFVQKRTLIGTNGLLSSTGAAGFLFSRGDGSIQGYGGNGEVINSVVAFDADPRSAAVLTSQSVPNNTGPTLVFSIDVDSPNTLKRLAFVNSPDYRSNQIIPASGLTTANGALVDFSATTGKVTAVLPFVGTRGAGKPSVTIEGGQQILRGSFLGVWDATGKNLAPNGATEVRLDNQTGAVASTK